MHDPKELVKIIYSEENLKRLDAARMRYEIYNGRLRDTIKEAISREFILPETVSEMINRIIPINITQKVINKLAGVYIDTPVRESESGNEQDTESVESIAKWTELDKSMKLLNRYFKLYKNALLESYVNSSGKPSVRALPEHTYTMISTDEIEPNIPTEIIKHVKLSKDRKKDVHIYWSDENHYAFDGEGNIIVDENNPDMVNPYGKMPFVYVNESSDLLYPIQDDDLISVQIAICLLLTDLAFATKYQAWSIIYLIGADTEKLSFNPSSVISLPVAQDGTRPEVGTIKPQIDSDAMLRQVEALVSMLLTTKNLSVNSVNASGLNAQNAASGVAKILDSSESTEDREDQVKYFAVAEKQYFELLAKHQMPAWIAAGSIDPKYVVKFSPDFELSISYPEMQPVVSESEKTDIEIKKLNAGITSKSMAIKELNPEYSQDEVNQVLLEIEKERAAEMEVAGNPEMIDDIEDESEQSDTVQ